MKPRFILFALTAALLLGFTSVSRLHAQDDADNDSAPSAQTAQPAPAPQPLGKRHNRSAGQSPDDQVMVLGDNDVAAGHTVDDAVVIMGQLTVDGHSRHDAVAVMGSSTINGTVDHDVVCVMGDLTLGPNAHVGHDVVCVLGHLHRDPGAYIGGEVVHEGGFGPNFGSNSALRHWWSGALRHGQMLTLVPGMVWIWAINLAVVVIYLIMALLFPQAMRRTGNQLAERPGHVILSGFLAIIALPILFVLLCVTVIGIPVALFLLPMSLVLMILFGKASLYGLIGRGLTRDRLALPFAVLLGVAVVILLLMCPFVGIGIYLLVSYLGFGCAVTALITARKAHAGLPPSVPPAPGGPMPPPVYPSPLVTPPSPMAEPAPLAVDPLTSLSTSAVPPPAATWIPPSSPVPPPAAPAEPSRPAAFYSAPMPPTIPLDATLPRANFWRRTGALAIDAVLIGIASEFAIKPLNHSGGFFLFLLAAYGAIMWKLRGTTVGGLICHLHVVRLDGRPIDWPTAIVRALGCYISLFVVGLGFIWVAFDPERQSWHDKLAGTTVVISVSRRSLV